ncbi:MAG: signal peptidase I [Caulobacterales bacterium]
MKYLIGGLALLGVVGVLLLAARVFVYQPYTMPSASMEPGIQRGDYFIVMRQRFAPALKRGDVIVFKLPSDGRTDYLKRLIGLPGDHIQIRGGRLYINGAAVAEKALGQGVGNEPGGMQPVLLRQETTPEGRQYDIQVSVTPDGAGDNTGVYVVPAHCYFTLGDNRDDSDDSRFDPGLAPGDPKLGGCVWNSQLDDAVGDEPGVGFVPEANLVGTLQWDFSLAPKTPGAPPQAQP